MWQQAVVVGNPTGLVTDGGTVGLDIVVVSILPDQTHALQIAVLVVPQNAILVPMQAIPGSGCQGTGGDGLGLTHAISIVGIEIQPEEPDTYRPYLHHIGYRVFSYM